MKRRFTTFAAISALMVAAPVWAADGTPDGTSPTRSNNAQAGQAQSGQNQSGQTQSSNARNDARGDDPTRAQKVSSTQAGDWISLTGKVKSVSDTGFTLGYGKGDITVLMDEYAWYENEPLDQGDRVTVTGRMDVPLLEDRTINASTVYVPNRDTYYYSDSAERNLGYYSYPVGTYSGNVLAEDDAWVGFSGTVASIEDEGLMVDIGARRIKVDTETMERSPVDAAGPKTVGVGDRIWVTGEMDDTDLFDTREVLASSIVVLQRNDRSTSSRR